MTATVIQYVVYNTVVYTIKIGKLFILLSFYTVLIQSNVYSFLYAHRFIKGYKNVFVHALYTESNKEYGDFIVNF